MSAGRSIGNRAAFPGAAGTGEGGLTKREYIAALVLQGMSGWAKSDMDAFHVAIKRLTPGLHFEEAVAQAAVIFADALLAELAKEQK